MTSQFPDSKPLADHPADSVVAWPVIMPYAYMGMTPVWVLMRMPDGTCAEGIGATTEEASENACQAWRQWKRGHPAPLAIDGHAYQRRLKARRKRGRRT